MSGEANSGDIFDKREKARLDPGNLSTKTGFWQLQRRFEAGAKEGHVLGRAQRGKRAQCAFSEDSVFRIPFPFQHSGRRFFGFKSERLHVKNPGM